MEKYQGVGLGGGGGGGGGKLSGVKEVGRFTFTLGIFKILVKTVKG